MDNNIYKKNIDVFFSNNFNKLLKLFKTHKYLSKNYHIDTDEMLSEMYIYMLSFPFFFINKTLSISTIENILLSHEFLSYLYNKYIIENRQYDRLIKEYKELFNNYNNLTQLEVEILFEMYINNRNEDEIAKMYNIKKSTLKNKVCNIKKKKIKKDNISFSVEKM